MRLPWWVHIVAGFGWISFAIGGAPGWFARLAFVFLAVHAFLDGISRRLDASGASDER